LQDYYDDEDDDEDDSNGNNSDDDGDDLPTYLCVVNAAIVVLYLEQDQTVTSSV
jgi:hypothetical protein